MSNMFSGSRILGMNTYAAHALGAAAGAGIGAVIDKDNPERGAAIGAGVGILGTSGLKLYKNYEKSAFRHIPMKGTLATLGLAGLAFAGGSLITPPTYQKASVASRSEDGTSYDQQTQYENYKYSLSDRTASMNVSGDLVFGLHNLRHG